MFVADVAAAEVDVLRRGPREHRDRRLIGRAQRAAQREDRIEPRDQHVDPGRRVGVDQLQQQVALLVRGDVDDVQRQAVRGFQDATLAGREAADHLTGGDADGNRAAFAFDLQAVVARLEPLDGEEPASDRQRVETVSRERAAASLQQRVVGSRDFFRAEVRHVDRLALGGVQDGRPTVSVLAGADVPHDVGHTVAGGGDLADVRQLAQVDPAGLVRFQRHAVGRLEVAVFDRQSDRAIGDPFARLAEDFQHGVPVHAA